MTRTSILVALCAGTFLSDVDAASAQRQSGLAGLAKRIDSLARPEADAELLSGIIRTDARGPGRTTDAGTWLVAE